MLKIQSFCIYKIKIFLIYKLKFVYIYAILKNNKILDIMLFGNFGCVRMKMDYIKFGNGAESFVILPGLSIHSVMRYAQAIEEAYKDFTNKYTVYVFDRAKNISDGYTVKDMAEDTAQKMKALGIQKADVFGASQGGMIALHLAIDYPQLVNKMILASTLAKPNDTFNEVLEEWIDLAEKKKETELISSFVDRVYSEQTLSAYRDVLISSEAGITDEEYRRFLILAKACRTYDCSAEISDIKCPVFVIGCEGDRVATAQASSQIAKTLNCKFYIYGKSYGHAVYDEAPNYKQRCLDFLKET